MLIGWIAVIAMTAADIVWLLMSRLVWIPPQRAWLLFLPIPLVGLVPAITWARKRLKGSGLAILYERLGLFMHAFAFNAALGLSLLVFTYLASSTSIPLIDAQLAAADAALGFHWPAFAEWVNERPFLLMLFSLPYSGALHQLLALYVYLSAAGRSARLAETCAALALVSLFGATISALLPAAGPIEHFRVDVMQLENLLPIHGHTHLDTYNMLRTSSAPFIDLDQAIGLMSFPSMHAAWAVIITNAVRDLKYVWPIGLIANSLALIGTMPKGGHYLADTIAGAMLAMACIVIVKLLNRRRA